jgi:hypothetical protein
MDEYLQRALTRMEAAARDMDAEALRRHRPAKWSGAEILEHLSRAFSSTTRLLGRRLEASVPEPSPATWLQQWRVLLVIELGQFPKGRPAPEFTLPRGLPAEEALPRFRETLAAMDDAITRCERQFGHGKIAAHPIFGPLTARQWRKFHWGHTRHHAKQVEALRKISSMD